MTPEEKRIINKCQQNTPVDITALATNFGLSVYKDVNLPQGVSGKIFPDKDSSCGYSILVNALEPYARRRFTVAHECAHYLLHRDKIGSSLSDNAMYRCENVTNQEEFVANNLAAELLMPKHLMDAEIKNGFDSIRDLADRFRVSEPAMKVRLRYLYQMDSI